MANYQKLYHIMFNAATSAETMILNADYNGALELLKNAQIEAEELYISADDEEMAAS
jgi:hypothetical protein